MRILKLPAKILYYVSDEFNKIFKNVFLCVSIQIAARINTGKSDMAIAHSWIWCVCVCVCVCAGVGGCVCVGCVCVGVCVGVTQVTKK